MTVRAAPVAAIGLWAGTLLAIHATALSPLAWLAAGAVGLALATRVGERRGVVAAAALAVATLLIGLGWGGLHLDRVRSSPLARPGAATIVGTLRTDPLTKPYGWSAVLGVDRVERASSATTVGGSLWLGGSGVPPAAVRGDRVAVEGAIRVPDDPGFADSLLRRGIAAGVKVHAVRVLGPSANPFIRASQGFRALVGRSIERLFAPRPAALLLGLALGDEGGLDDATRRDFRATGLGHLLVVSGQNVAMVLAPLLLLATRLRLPRGVQLLVGLLAVGFFVVVTGVESSVLRAGVMACLGLLGGFLGRPRDGITLLSGAVLVLLVLDPALAHAVGFQLSAGATAGMVLLASPLADRFAFLPRPLALALGATLSAQLAVTPVLLAVFREIPLVTILANVLAAPAVAPALLLGLAAAGVGLVSPALGLPLAHVASVPSTYITWIADRLARAPVAWITSDGGPTVFVVGSLVVVAIGVAVRRRLPRAAAAAALAFLVVATLASAVRAGAPAAFTVTFLDVGQGDSTLLTSPEGATVLVDAGPDRDVVARELVALGIHRLDVVVATHPHADHVEGFASVLARFAVGLLLVPGCPDDVVTAADLDRLFADEGLRPVVARAGMAFAVADLRLEVLSPDRCWQGTNSDTNNDSVVLLASVGGDRVLLSGDLEVDAQQVLLDRGVDVRAAVLKVPHHGGATSLPEFLAAVGATVAVVSVGQPNDYGHPVPEMLEALRAAGARVLRTDELGTIVVTLERRRVAVRWAA